MKYKLITNQIATIDTDKDGGWDEAGEYGDIQLYNATLVVDTPGGIKAGTKIDSIAFIFSQSLCELYDEDGKSLEKFPLKLSIG